MAGGPKLRKWYGAPDLLPNDGGSEEDDEDDESDGEQSFFFIFHILFYRFDAYNHFLGVQMERSEMRFSSQMGIARWVRFVTSNSKHAIELVV